ncbi:MAG TPA: sigma-70 family RNA polymerase sigma factor [Blastocatellia bacterium]|nr:sigma-70 family RNA polymerase sigma factor [Blastocatellia bacterium]
MSLARAGSEPAFEEIVRRHSPRVFQIASHFFRQRELAEEAAQEAFLKAYTQLSSYEGRGSFEGWLARLTTNLCLNLLRSAKRRPEATAADLTDDEGEWLDNQLSDLSAVRHQSSERGRVAADLAEKVLREMSADDRLVLMSLDGDDLSVKEVAEMTGWTAAKVKTQAFRARRRMREAVEALLNRRQKHRPE